MFCFQVVGSGTTQHAQARGGGRPCGGVFRERFQQQKEANQFSILMERLQNGSANERSAASSAIVLLLKDSNTNVLCDKIKELAETRSPLAWKFMRDAARARGGAVAHKAMWQSERVKDSSNEREISSFQEAQLAKEARNDPGIHERFEGFRQSMAEQRASVQAAQQPQHTHQPLRPEHNQPEKVHQKMREAPGKPARLLPSIISLSKQAAAALWNRKKHENAAEEPNAPEGVAAKERSVQKTDGLAKGNLEKAEEGKVKIPKPRQKPPAPKEKRGKAGKPSPKDREEQGKRRKKAKAEKQIAGKDEKKERKKRKPPNAIHAAAAKAKNRERRRGKKESAQTPAQKSRKTEKATGRKREAEKQRQRKKSRTLSELVKRLLEKKKARRKKKRKPPVLAHGLPDDDKDKKKRKLRKKAKAKAANLR